jgi:hypothetical protein
MDTYEVHEKNTVKSSSEKKLICYCFGYSALDIQDDFIKNGRSLIIDRIMAAKKDGLCNCAKINPKGG